MQLQNFWADDYPHPGDLPLADHLPEAVEVAVIGSGYTGLSAARTLARGGTGVAVLESETIGWGASSRNGGMTSPGLKQGIQKIFRRYGPEKGRQFWQASMDAVDLIEQIIQEDGIACDWDRRGYLALAAKDTHFVSMRQHADWLRQNVDYTVEVVSQADLRREIGTDSFYGGLLGHHGGGLHPAKYVWGLARGAARAGACLVEHAPVTAIRRANGAFALQTGRGVLAAREVIIATNGYTDWLAPGLKPKVFPVGSYIIVTGPLSPELQQALSPNGRMFYDSKWFLNYFRLTPDGRMLWGGRNDLSTDLDLAVSARVLRQQMVGVFPELAGAPVTHTWTGKLGITFDLMPDIGRRDGIHYALGYGGHGLSMATYLGREIARIVMGEKTISPFMEIPHQTMFFYRNRPWFIPLVAAYYRLLDKVS